MERPLRHDPVRRSRRRPRRCSSAMATKRPTPSAASTSPLCAVAIAEHGGPRGPVDRRRADGRLRERGRGRSLRRGHAARDAGPARLELRVGLDAGEPLPEGDDLYGTPVIVAERLCDAAGPGEILASEVVAPGRGARGCASRSQPRGALRLRGIGRARRGVAGRWAARTPAPRRDARRRPGEITVVVADDQRLLRAGFRVILDAEPDITRRRRGGRRPRPRSTSCARRRPTWC